MSEEKNEVKYNVEQFEILKRCSDKKDVTEWNEYRVKNKNEYNQDIEAIELKNEDLSYSHLEGADLRGAHLERANLYCAHLEGADLRIAHLERAFMSFAYLDGANLQYARLEGATLMEAHLVGANLDSAHFVGVDLSRANLKGANLSVATLKDADLSYSHLEGANLESASLEGADLEGANLESADLRDIFIGEYINEDNNTRFTNFEKCLFGNAILSINDKCKNNVKEKDILESLSKAEVNNVRFIDPVFGRKVRDEAWLYHFKKSCKEGISRFYKQPLLWLWKITSNYGRSFFLWFLWSVIIAGFFGLQFASMGRHHFDINHLGYTLETMFYYSVVTFTTLGFGDIVPKSTEASWWVMGEVFLGYIMLGGLVSIFANKLARRND